MSSNTAARLEFKKKKKKEQAAGGVGHFFEWGHLFEICSV